ncbi:V-type ATP synthase subunit A [candidate division WOR-3 bacterium JGI_Cruoil_03_51_56]|uniref:V-type ATP synthase alpha chain n=1 Tax=candidate division WOR-3 bacterium JGI_Cruoil_03_51_56 TaxID=1973747 RepID=A0A235BY58_UNCW3|nr:MAG: V-type ATP synthase subunit A [candidate division WOR-3 bacterium JGI_Cruoil_03_51_56]
MRRNDTDKSARIGKITKVSGPLVVAEGMTGSRMFDVVKVSDQRLIGEIINLNGDQASIQVYEETDGVGPGDPVYLSYHPLTVELGPGVIGGIYDGVQRPLEVIRQETGEFIGRGVEAPALDRNRRWHFKPVRKKGDTVGPGDVIGETVETVLITHKIMVPPGIRGQVIHIKEGEFTVEQTVAVIETEKGPQKLNMIQRWPVRRPRPFRRKLAMVRQLVTGTRVIDTFFPIAEGGTACVPGPFGSGKTVIQHQFAKWSSAQVIVFVGCGERGNEMTDVLMEFPKLRDPKTDVPLMKRTILIANTSNMPVAGREASVYTGITMAEYYRDMGYSVALQADSTSRWAEAMREISGRLEEMPGEEGYPAYLASRIAQFYERAGRVVCLGNGGDGKDIEGALTVVGSVSPPGGDLNDPVVQATLRVVKVFWSLEEKLAFKRHFPAISWLNSYSLYSDALQKDIAKQTSEEFSEDWHEAMTLLGKEAELEEIVRLIGRDSLSPIDRMLLETCRSIREDFLHQNAFHEIDTYTTMKKQALMLRAILYFHTQTCQALSRGADIASIERMKIRNKIARMKYLSEDEIENASRLVKDEIDRQIKTLEPSNP